MWALEVEYQASWGALSWNAHSHSSCKFYLSFLSFQIVQDLLTRVEEAVDKFLYWDEEVTIIEAVTSVSVLIYTVTFNQSDV